MKGQSTAVQREKAGLSVSMAAWMVILDRVHGANTSIARRAYEIFNHEGRGFGRDLEHWLRAKRNCSTLCTL